MRIVRAMGAGLLLTAAIPAPAYADVAGRYETVDDDVFMKMEMTLEVDDQGNMRMQQGGAPSYYLLLDGEMYGVSRQAGDASVVRLSDLALIARETFDQMGVSGAFAEAEDSEPIKFSEMGPQTVGGRSGTAYGIVSEDSDKPGWGSLVISDDPRLAPLGKAMADAQKSQVKGMDRWV